MKRRQFLVRSGAGLAGVLGYTHWLEPFWLDVTTQALPIAHLPASLDGKTLLQLSDLHIGPSVDEQFLRRVWRTGAALQPDIVAYTGDFVTWRGPQQLRQLEAHLPHMPKGRMATLSVLGNHDHGVRWSERNVADAVVDTLTQGGMRVLRNEAVDVDGMQMVGIEDWWSQLAAPEKALAGWRRGTPALVLNHNPDCMDAWTRWNGYDGWVLSGHTHGGQCKSPFLAPPIIPVRNKRYTSGEIAVGDGRRVYISRGVGYNIQWRFNVRPEITLFTLRRA